MARKKTTKRQGAAVTVWLPLRLKQAAEAYLASSRPKTSLKATIEAALEDFLEAKGYWPPQEPAGQP